MKFKSRNKKIKILDKQILKVSSSFGLTEVLDKVDAIRVEKQNNLSQEKIYLFFETEHKLVLSQIHYQVLCRNLDDRNQEFSIILPDFMGAPKHIPSSKLVVAFDSGIQNANLHSNPDTEFRFKKGSKNPNLVLNQNLKSEQEKELELYQKSLEGIKSHAAKALPNSAQNYSSKLFLSFSLSASIFCFFFIAAFAFPSTTIQLVPRVSSIEQVLNIHMYLEKPLELKDSSSANMLKLEKLEIPNIETQVKFVSTGVSNIGSNASGQIVIQNSTAKPWTLIPFTRFQSQEALIFRSQEQLRVPAGTPENPGTLQALVTADAYDLAGVSIGDRGNLAAGVKLTLPGLKDASAKAVFATTSSEFLGGTTIIEKFVQESDLLAAREFAIKELEVKLASILKDQLLRKNEASNLDLQLLNDPETMHIKKLTLAMERNLVGQKLHTFQVDIKASVQGYAFSQSQLKKLLVNKLVSNLDPYNTLAFVDYDNLSYKVFNQDKQNQILDATMVIKGLQQAKLTGSTLDVQELFSNIKADVIGLESTKALKRLKQSPYVESAVISHFPFWQKHVSSNVNNLKISVNESI